MKELRDTFEQIAELLQYILHSNNLQLIPVGSFVIGCVRKGNFSVDSYLHLDSTNGDMDCDKIVQLFREKKEGVDCPSPLFFNFTLSMHNDRLNNAEYISFNNIKNSNRIRVFLMNLGNQAPNGGGKTMNHYTAGIYHSNWLGQSLSAGQNNPGNFLSISVHIFI